MSKWDQNVEVIGEKIIMSIVLKNINEIVLI